MLSFLAVSPIRPIRQMMQIPKLTYINQLNVIRKFCGHTVTPFCRMNRIKLEMEFQVKWKAVFASFITRSYWEYAILPKFNLRS